MMMSIKAITKTIDNARGKLLVHEEDSDLVLSSSLDWIFVLLAECFFVVFSDEAS